MDDCSMYRRSQERGKSHVLHEKGEGQEDIQG